MQLDEQIAGAVSVSARGTEVKVWAVPGASQTEIVGMHAGAVRIRVAAPAHADAANQAISDFLSEVLQARTEVRRRTSRSKRVLVDLPAEVVIARLTQRIAS